MIISSFDNYSYNINLHNDNSNNEYIYLNISKVVIDFGNNIEIFYKIFLIIKVICLLIIKVICLLIIKVICLLIIKVICLLIKKIKINLKNTSFPYKIWISWTHITKPFYMEDACFYSHISVMKKLSPYVDKLFHDQ